ncbi:MAG: M48 family metallopeptidase [Verrucomicrobiota bacterium]
MEPTKFSPETPPSQSRRPSIGQQFARAFGSSPEGKKTILRLEILLGIVVVAIFGYAILAARSEKEKGTEKGATSQKANSVPEADSTSKWQATIQRIQGGLEFAQNSATEYAKTKYPQFFPEVPMMKRTQFNLMSVDQEIEVGNRVWSTIETNPIPADLDQAQSRITNVASRLAVAAKSFTNALALDLKFRVVADSNFNAFCIAGGKIAVNSGVLAVARNDDELSFVLAHEIGHAIARHAGETLTREFLREKGMAGAAFIADWAAQQKHIQRETVTNILVGLDAATVMTVTLPHKREQEAEADHLGLILMSKARYRPEAAVDLWQRMAAAQSDANSLLAREISKYCNGHPPDAERVANLKLWLPDAQHFSRSAAQ